MEAPQFFKSQGEWRRWLARNYDSAAELWVGFYKVATGKASLTYHEALDEALCFGWIDGVRKSVDDESYKIRFTPRLERSRWSRVNIRRAEQLIESGLMQPPGLEAFNSRQEAAAGYSYENHGPDMEVVESALKANRKAWTYWQKMPPWYKRTVTFWVTSAKRAETRQRRLRELVFDCSQGKRIRALGGK